MTHTCVHPYPLLISRDKYTYISGRGSLKYILEHFTTYTSSCLLEMRLMISTHTHPTYLNLIACTNTQNFHNNLFKDNLLKLQTYNLHLILRSSFTLIGAFPVLTCSVTRNLCTNFISVEQMVLIDSCIAECTVRHPGI